MDRKLMKKLDDLVEAVAAEDKFGNDRPLVRGRHGAPRSAEDAAERLRLYVDAAELMQRRARAVAAEWKGYKERLALADG